MKTLYALILSLFTLSAFADTQIEAWINVTNTPSGIVVTQRLVWNASQSRIWTNAPVNPDVHIQSTNNIQNSTTNLHNHLDAYKFKAYHQIYYGTNTNQVVVIAGTNEANSIVIDGLWGYVFYITNTVYGSDFVMAPFTAFQSNTFRNFQMSALVTMLDVYATNKFSYTNILLTNYPHSLRSRNPTYTNLSTMGGTNRPTEFLATNGALYNVSSSNMVVTNLTGTITNSFIADSTNSNVAITNSPRANIDIAVVTNALILSGIISNTIVTNSPSVNAAWVFASNSYAFSGVHSNILLTNVTGLNGNVGNITNGFLQGFAAKSLSMTGSLSLGTFMVTPGSYPTANILFDSTWNLFGSAAGDFGVENVDTGDIPVRFASASGAGTVFILPVTISNVTTIDRTLSSSNIVSRRQLTSTNATLYGSNILSGDLSFPPKGNAALANGYNSGVVLGTNVWVKISGPIANYTNVGFLAERDGSWHKVMFDNQGGSVAILNESGLDAVAENRIVTGTGGAIAMTNRPAWAEVIYDLSSTRWRVISNSQ